MTDAGVLAKALRAYVQSMDDAASLVLGVSGGRDSVALAVGLARLLPASQLLVAHVHHHLRGEDADADAAAVAGLAADLGLRCQILHLDVPGYRARHRLSALAAARAARYQALGCLVAVRGARALVSAHTSDDQIETVLMNVERGTDVRGLAGMRVRTTLQRDALGPPLEPPCPVAWEEVEVHRPLLGVPRAATAAYCRAEGFSYRDDPSNLDLRHRRVQVRRILLPALRAESPLAEQALVALARDAAGAREALDAAVGAALRTLAEPVEQGTRIDVAALERVGGAVRPYLLVAAWRALARGHGELGRPHVRALERLASCAGRRRVAHLPAGTIAVREGRWLYLQREPIPTVAAAAVEPLPLSVPGQVALADGRVVRATLSAPPERFEAEADGAWLDAALARRTLAVRAPRTGDRFRPLGAPGRKALRELFIDRKLAQAERRGAVVLTAGDDLVWVQGIGVADPARVPAGARLALRLEVRAPRRPGASNGRGGEHAE